MSATATSTEPTAAAATEAVPQDPPGQMPQDLLDAGWSLKEHVGPDSDKFQCVHAALGKTTNAFYRPQDAIKSARNIQKKMAAGHLPEQIAGNGKGSVTRQFTQPLKVKLSQSEVIEKFHEYKAKKNRLAEIEREAKEVAKGYKGQTDVLEKEVGDLYKILDDEAETRETACEERFDYDAKVARIIRLDTGEEESSRSMTEKELQQKLPIA